jgi:hypothetical protein rflaF_06331
MPDSPITGLPENETSNKLLKKQAAHPPEKPQTALQDVSQDIPQTEKKKNIFIRFGKSIVRNSNKIITVISYFLPIMIFLCVLASVVFYITVGFKSEFHSDCTDTIMWANASHESGHVYDKNFSYACFLPFGINLIMQPLISIFGLSLKAHIMGMLGYLLLLTVFFCLMLKEMHWGLRSICLAASVMLAITVSSQKLREIFWQHTIYYSLGLLFIVIGLYLYFRLQNLSKKRLKLDPKEKKAQRLFLHFLITFVCLAVFVMFTATDGISALSIFAIPFIAAIFAEAFSDTSNKIFCMKNLKTLAAVAVFGVMIILGIKLNERWIGDMKAGYQDAYSVYSGMNTWIEHIQMLPLAWMRLFGVEDMTNKPLFEKESILNLIRIAASVILAVMPVIATCYYSKIKKTKDAQPMRIWIWIHWASSAIVLVGYICGLLSSADWRLTPIIGTSLMLSIIFVRYTAVSKISSGRIIALLSIPVIFVSLVNVYGLVKISNKDHKKENYLFGLTELIEDAGLSYGYATFWNANAITLISDSKVKVRDVNINEYGVSKRLYQSSSEWYKDQPGQDKYFLLLNSYEYNVISTADSSLIENATQNLSAFVNGTEYRILVFDYNIVS